MLRAAFALATGALLAIAFPAIGLWPVAFVALVPLLSFAMRASARRSFAAGFGAGLLLYVLAVPWIVNVMTHYGGIGGVTAVLVMLLLHAYLACYYGLFAALLARAARRSKALALGIAPPLWMGLEWVRNWLFSGFPWIPLGLSQWKDLPLLQHAEWGAVYAVSGIVVLANAGLVALSMKETRRLGTVALGIFAVFVLTGWHRLETWDARVSAMPRTLAVGVVQAMAPMEERWDPESVDDIERRHFDATHALAGNGARLVLWSESSIPILGGFWKNPAYERRLGALVHREGVALIFGGTSHEYPGGREIIYNSAFAIDGDGRVAGRYDKQHLVPFGEYVPMQRLLFFAEKLVREVGDFGRGSGPAVLDVAGARVGSPICYEIVFPEICRAFENAGADLLITLTNDAWFGHSAAAEQHFANAALRAVETRRFFVRCANTGISGVIAPSGRVEKRTPIFEEATFVADVALLSGRTPYARTGDVLPIAGLVLGLIAALAPGRSGASV
ncbi:MAG: apolipoprotein N-acyltransferase [Acidobacteriota bacterium]